MTQQVTKDNKTPGPLERLTAPIAGLVSRFRVPKLGGAAGQAADGSEATAPPAKAATPKGGKPGRGPIVVNRKKGH